MQLFTHMPCINVMCFVAVWGVTQLHDVVYIVCYHSSTISRFNATTHRRLTDFDVKGLRWPLDIAACERTSQVYVAELAECVWRVSSDGTDRKRWLPKSRDDTFKPHSLSVTSARLLVTSRSTNHLTLFDADGDELIQIQLPDDMEPEHAVESPTGTFIVSHSNTELKQYQVVEVNMGGEVLRQFSGSRLPLLRCPEHIAVDSHGNILAADVHNRHILLLDAHLSLCRVIIDEHQLNDKPLRLCYKEDKGQLLVGLYGGVAVFNVLCR